MVYSCINNILSTLYPDHCELCGAPARNALCSRCRDALPFNSPRCRYCALPLPAASPVECCGGCSRSHRIEQSVIPLRYEPPVDRLIGPFKFNGRLRHGRLLSELVLEAVEQAGGPLPERL
ncbi:MAG: double zinc ribbon domain-containing protein, partial [Sedimenticola sp.]|nr:double zinc ribbon domain-containing protein [Sedimenticola sp.]